MNKETGGPAFPFAAKAMQELVGVCDADVGADRAYKWADAMLKARKK